MIATEENTESSSATQKKILVIDFGAGLWSLVRAQQCLKAQVQTMPMKQAPPARG